MRADMRSRFTRDGRCSYTFVLPPSDDRTCGSGHDLRARQELQQVTETVEHQQSAVRHMQGELERLAQQADDVEGRVMLLEGKPSSLLWEEVLRLQKQNQALAGQGTVMFEFLEGKPSSLLCEEVLRLQKQNQALAGQVN
ncbi:uncharacterized protein LOC118419287 [Branchiostoma floridae]|uniref:Uncharacterized protein LOC118419287 n=1 Tax=Branchiostoma floridae TaxID=7739 RepID=A0A9J7MUD5_BRAFL|nr:uncharacterized protein LOC118419287 [Branchiostoma floridae]